MTSGRYRHQQLGRCGQNHWIKELHIKLWVKLNAKGNGLGTGFDVGWLSAVVIVPRTAVRAGLEGFYLHEFRHGFAHGWLAAGGQENDLMRLAGWKSRQIVGRYAASAADERARDAHRRMALRDRF